MSSKNTIILKLEHRFNQTPIKRVLEAYQQKMLSRKDNETGTVFVRSIVGDKKTITYSIKRKMPLFCIQFFNFNHIEYDEVAKIVDANTIEISSKQQIKNIIMTTSMKLLYNTVTKDTDVIAIVKGENVPKILKLPMKKYAEKAFKLERSEDEKYIAAK